MRPGNIIQLTHEVPDRVDADLRRYYREQEFIETHCPTLQDYEDDELIAELESRGYIINGTNE